MRTLAQPRRRTFGPLNAIEFAASEGSPTIVCLHGYGADAANLAPLAQQLDLSGPARWLFPDGPRVIELGPGFYGRAWFDLDHERINEAQMAGNTMDLSNIRPPGFDEALSTIAQFIEAAEVTWDKLIIGGFSQGAMLALEIALNAPQMPLGLYILSGTLVDDQRLRERAPARKGLRFFQSHGTNDQLLGFKEASKLNSALNEAGLSGELLSFSGGHELPSQASEGLRQYLNSILEAKNS